MNRSHPGQTDDSLIGTEPMATPLTISVIVPNYNHARYLEERLGSVFAQVHPPHEIIFLDDASTDDSVRTARLLAPQSPAPFHLVANEKNSGSTFHQWLKGISMATGDLIWIAESDDSCRPEFLERLVPHFTDPDVVLAYSQSAIIGATGEIEHTDYHAYTNTVSTTRWRTSYTAAALDEVELALSRMNTIPNASAVVFRKPTRLDFASDLERLRLAGDWFFYAMRLRDGKIAFVPESLNYHRRHDRTVRAAVEREGALIEERMFVKMRLFEEYPISTDAISRSLGWSIREYWDRAPAAGRHETGLVSDPRLAKSIDRIHAAFQKRVVPAPGPRILIVVEDLDSGSGHVDAIRLANALAERQPVYLCNARQTRLSPRIVERIDDRVVLIEGTLGETPWNDPEVGAGGHVADLPRLIVLRELIRFHRIDVIQSFGWWADRLTFKVFQGLDIPWFIDLRGRGCDAEDDPMFGRLIGPMMTTVRAAYYASADDLRIFENSAIPRPRHLIRIDDGLENSHDFLAAGQTRTPGNEKHESDDVAALVSEAVSAAIKTVAFPRSETHPRERSTERDHKYPLRKV